MYLGDWVEDSTHDFKFTTRDDTGLPATLSGSPAISVYKANNTTQTTTGVTLTADFDSVTGLNHVRIDTSDAFYAVANDYDVVITAGTVDGVSVVGEVVGAFSIENRFKEADVTLLAGDAQSLADLKDFVDAGYDPSTNKVQGVVLTDTVTTYTGNTPQTGDAFARLGAPAGASVSADIAAIEAQTDDIGAAGAGLSAVPWNAAWDAEVQSEVADALGVYDPPTHAELQSEINDVQTDVATRASQASVDTIDDFLDTEIAALITAVDALPTNAELATALAAADDAVLAAIAALNNLSAAQVNAEVVDALNVDTYAEPGAVPAATASLVTKIGFLVALARNKLTSTATTITLRNDADSGSIGTAAHSDDGTTYTRNEWA